MSSGPARYKGDYYTSSYDAPRYEETLKRSGQPQVISASDYKVNEYKENPSTTEYKTYEVKTDIPFNTEYRPYEVKNDVPYTTDYKTYEVKTDFDKKGIVPYDYRTSTFANYEYKPSEYKPTEYKPTEYVAYQPTAYKVEEFVVNDYKPSTELYQERPETMKRAGVTTEVFIEKKIENDGSEEAQIRLMGQEIERIRASNSDTFNRFSRLQSEKSEITMMIIQRETELEGLRKQGNNSQILLQIDEKNKEIERLKISSGGVRIVENPKEIDDLLKMIKEADHGNDVLRRKIEELELQKKRHLAEMEDNRGLANKNRPVQTSWCC